MSLAENIPWISCLKTTSEQQTEKALSCIKSSRWLRYNP